MLKPYHHKNYKFSKHSHKVVNYLYHLEHTILSSLPVRVFREGTAEPV